MKKATSPTLKTKLCRLAEQLKLKELRRLRWKNLLLLVAAGCINAVGVTMFLAPVNLYDSGISGTSMLLSQLTPASLSLFLILLNVPLFLFGMKKQGILLRCILSGQYSFIPWLRLSLRTFYPLMLPRPPLSRERTCSFAQCSAA